MRWRRHHGQQVVLDAAPREVIEHLVGRGGAAAGKRRQLRHVGDVEIAHAPVADLAGLLQAGERLDGFVQRRAAAPVQQIKVDAVGVEVPEAALAGRDGAAPRRVARQHLADDEHAVAFAGDRLGDDLLGRTVAIHLRGVDQGHAQVDPGLQRRDLVLAPGLALAHAPRAEAEGRHRFAGGELGCRHGRGMGWHRRLLCWDADAS